MVRCLIIAIAMLAMGVQGPLVSPARAQDSYPSRNITIVVGFAAGGTSDIIARLLGQKITEYTGANVVIENIPGAASMTATEKVARATPDGYTLYMPSSTPFATNPNFYRKLRYSFDDFEPVILVARVPLAFDVRADFPATTVKEFVEHARKQTHGVTIAIPGRGSVGEIVNGMARGILDIKIQDVPYRGSTPAVADLLKGVVDAYFDAISSSIPLYQAGNLKMLAVTGRNRSPGAPNVPTLIELGYKDFMLENVYSIVAPKGTPAPVVEKLNGLIRRAMSEPKFLEILLAQGVVPEPSTPEELRAVIVQDYEWNASMAKRFDIKPID
jgi:tripartite-type tricarboxylate transporter receptor subunit TctC